MAVANYDGGRYLVCVLGKDATWMLNVRATGGRVAVHRGCREQVRLEEVKPADRVPILRRYLAVAPGARPHLPVGQHPPLEELGRTADQFPPPSGPPRSRERGRT